jgi:cytidylate kinase
MTRDDLTESEAAKNIQQRQEINFARWQAMYADQWKEWVVEAGLVDPNDPIDFWDPRIYDLAINTSENDPEQTAQAVLQKLGY